MNPFERACIEIRHSRLLADAEPVWNAVRPTYDKFIGTFARGGLQRTINGTDPILVSPAWRGVNESYEPLFWGHLMGKVSPGDIVADVGAYIGLYSVALARRVGPTGKVFAFEPDPINCEALISHLKLNQAVSCVDVLRCAVGDFDGDVAFRSGRSSESHVVLDSSDGTRRVECCKLDTILQDQRVDILKIDVEGFEEKVLRGGRELLSDRRRSPRAIYIEVHPFAWERTHTSSDTLLNQLAACGYHAFALDGHEIKTITEYGSVVAHSC